MSIDTRARAAAAAVQDVADRVALPDPEVLVRRHATRRRTRTGILSVCALVVIGALAIPVLGRDDGSPVVSTPPASTGSSVGDRYVPPTTTAHGLTRMPITLPDGRPFTISYAPELDAAQLGFRATMTAGLRTSPLGAIQWRTLAVLHTTAAQRYSGLTPAATYADSHGRQVPFYIDPGAPERSGLTVQVGSWLVVVPDLDDPANHPDDHLTPDQLALWAQHLQGWIGDDGFPVLFGDQELSLQASMKDAFLLGPSVGGTPSISVGDRELCEGAGTDTTNPRRFVPNPRGTAKGAAWCDRATGLHVSVIGSRRFVDRAVESFHIAPFSARRRATRIVLSTGTVRSGASVPGVVVVYNAGSPVDARGCQSPFMVMLVRGRPPAPVEPDCSELAVVTVVPSGETAYPITVRSAVADRQSPDRTCFSPAPCPLPAGNYRATISFGLRAFPTARPIPVKVVG